MLVSYGPERGLFILFFFESMAAGLSLFNECYLFRLSLVLVILTNIIKSWSHFIIRIMISFSYCQNDTVGCFSQ